MLSGGYVDLSAVAAGGRGSSERFGRPVTIDNDASMALVAEARLGAGRGARNLALLTIGTGIGGGIMDDGRILRGGGHGRASSGISRSIPTGRPASAAAADASRR